uniref:Uncharacterized protein n=1 Tax=Anguilla anguilla TaxID=7936 RepID=A0A0E9S5S5_ANGAN
MGFYCHFSSVKPTKPYRFNSQYKKNK